MCVCVARYAWPYNNEPVETNLDMVIEEFKAKVLIGSGWLAARIAHATHSTSPNRVCINWNYEVHSELM